MYSTNKRKNVFLTLDGHNDPALNIGWIKAINRGKIWQINWYKKNKDILNEKLNELEVKIEKKIIPLSKLSDENKEILNLQKNNLKKKLVKFIKEGKIIRSDGLATVIILLNQKYYKCLELSYYIRLMAELTDNELIFCALCLSDLKKKKHFPYGSSNYKSDFLKYNFYNKYKKDLDILKLLKFRRNRSLNKKNFNLDDCVQYRYYDEFKVDSYDHQISFDEIQKNREIIKNELNTLWTSAKWKNEETLFQNLKLLLAPKNIIPIKWHQNQKLKRQHLDIYFEINKKKYGVEYQGKQHFKPIKFFGGKKALKNRIRLDKLKRIRCSRAKISLITFNYNEQIDKQSVTQKLLNFGVNLTKERKMYV